MGGPVSSTSCTRGTWMQPLRGMTQTPEPGW